MAFGDRLNVGRGVVAKAARLGALLAMMLGGNARADTTVHPQDGPHADIRIRISDEVVRFNVLMNLAFADEIAPVYREAEGAVHPVEEQALQQGLMAYFREKNRVMIDGVEVTPVLREFSVERGDLSMLPLFPIIGTKGLVRINVELEYSAKSPPKKVAMYWATFPPDFATRDDEGNMDPMQVVAQLEAEGTFKVFGFTAQEPEYVWYSTGKKLFEEVPEIAPSPKRTLPVVSIGLFAAAAGGVVLALAGSRSRTMLFLVMALVTGAGGWMTLGVGRMEIGGAADASLTEAQALSVFHPLHANIYRAFDYNEEGEIYDALARSVDGDLLDSLYNEVYQSLIMEEEERAVSRVQEVRPVATEVITADAHEFEQRAFTARHRWQVDGVVYHWGHSHTRTNEYFAEYTVVHLDEGWRIATSKTLESFRVDAAPLVPGEL